MIWKDIPNFKSMAWFAGLSSVVQLLPYFYEMFLWVPRGKI